MYEDYIKRQMTILLCISWKIGFQYLLFLCLLLDMKRDIFAIPTNCLQNIKKVYIKKYATTLTLTWEFSCSNISINAFKIYYQHED